MIFHTPIMAMLLASLLSTAIIAWAAWFSVQVLRHWDTASGHARQIAMERRTYLVSTALAFVMVLELASLMLFVFNADKMAVMFVGAMCAVGTLNVNAYGMPALILKIIVFFSAAVWLVINHVDAKGRDYPLTRFKYAFLLALAPVMVAAAALQLAYFLNLNADVITSCCSKLFTPETTGIDARLSAADPKLALWLFGGGVAAMLALAVTARRHGRFALIYAIAGAGFFGLSIVAIVSVISSYIYEQPHHHCPFCILKPEYDYIGYGLYLPLFAGTAFALAAGFLSLGPLPASLKDHLPATRRGVILLSAAFYVLFGLMTLYAIFRSHLILFN
jgi:hypothetical protein